MTMDYVGNILDEKRGLVSPTIVILDQRKEDTVFLN